MSLIYSNYSIIMFPEIFSRIQSREHKKIIENIFSLSILQGLNYILPLVTFPYLVRILGTEKFGLISFAQAYITYFMIVVDYGFNMTGTREIAINKNDKPKISEIFSSLSIARVFLAILCFIVLSFSVFIIPKFSTYWYVYLLTFGMVIGNLMFPVWFFQGIEEMKYITFLNFVSKILFTVLIFVVVKKESDFYYVPLLNSAGYLIAGILSLWLIFRKYAIKITSVSWHKIFRTLREGWYLFASRISISLYTVTNSFILGLFESLTVVGLYVAADKIVRASMNIFVPIYQSLYPRYSQKAAVSRDETIRSLRKLLIKLGVIALMISIFFLIFSERIVLLILGAKYSDAISVFKILSFIPFIVTIASVLSNLTMIPFRLDRHLMRIYMVGVIINILLIFVLVGVSGMKGEGAALSNLVTETVLTVLMFFGLLRNKINLFTVKKSYA